jgi:hypothetical protein
MLKTTFSLYLVFLRKSEIDRLFFKVNKTLLLLSFISTIYRSCFSKLLLLVGPLLLLFLSMKVMTSFDEIFSHDDLEILLLLRMFYRPHFLYDENLVSNPKQMVERD